MSRTVLSRRFRLLKHEGAALLSSWSQVSLCVRVVPKTTLRLSDSLEGLSGLREALMLLITAHYSKRMPIKISKGKRCVGKV